MDNDFLIPLLVTLVTAMAIGAVYLLTLLMNDGQQQQDSEETLSDYVADTATAPAAQSESEAGDAAAPAKAQQN
jgi:hypothetical protein